MTGSWTKHSGLTVDHVHALSVYDNAISQLKGLGITRRTTGIFFKKTVSAATQYAFASEQAAVTAEPCYQAEWIYVTESFDGQISEVSIQSNAPQAQDQLGGWSQDDGLTVDNVHALAVYQQAIQQQHIMGVTHRTTGVYYRQLVNGTNYAFASESAPVIPHPSFTAEWAYTHESLDHNVAPAVYKDHAPEYLEASVSM